VLTFVVSIILGILEGSDVQARLEHVFRLMVERTLWSRGRLATEDVTGGVPGNVSQQPADRFPG
jgi:hypothetical protein